MVGRIENMISKTDSNCMEAATSFECTWHSAAETSHTKLWDTIVAIYRQNV